jgi:glycosyltransferase involved in cell wall biosynthesis
MPLISVILPVYNTEKYIAEAVQSILDQTFADFELLIINDASTDKTLDIISSFDDERIKIINNEVNLKVVKCLNIGLEAATGKFIARMDADDVAYKERLQVQLDFFKANPDVALCATWVERIGDQTSVHSPSGSHEEIKGSLLFHNVIIHPTVMFRAEAFRANGLKYDESFINAEDYGLWVEAIDKIHFGIIPQILLRYRMHENNVSVHKESNWHIVKAMNFKAYKKLLDRMGIHYSERDLNLNLNLGFALVEKVSEKEFDEYVAWLNRLLEANDKRGYFQKDVFKNEIVHKFCVLTSRKALNTNKFYFRRVKTLYQNKLLGYYFRSKIKRLTLRMGSK